MTSNRPPPFFVGEHPALDFLNTTATPRGALVEWLVDGKDLIDWLELAGAIEPAAAARFREFDGDTLYEVARDAREFRRWLRGFITARMGKPLRATSEEIAPLNALLAGDSSFQRVEVAGPGSDDECLLQLRKVYRWEDPKELLQPIAEATTDLICNQDFRLIQSCEGSTCSLLFIARTKGRARRWCSMAICGNRAKVAAHRARRGVE
ncbi:CGNR zinc finger domain-containing protein [Tundrisphaera lichenicola]|uniref:CGNR zinc finger domain-containing protein n=1 Tax=Tundrisphaera lichenicola TaxID=2029860 RepID=UPI003EBAEA12